MSFEFFAQLDALRRQVQVLAQDHRIASAGTPETNDNAHVDERAALGGGTDYLLARVRLLEAEVQAAALHLVWMAPGQVAPPRDALARIKALCGYHADPYDLLMAVQATHPGVTRDILSATLKSFRADFAAMSTDDITGLLTAAWNGGRHGYDAVKRTRKQAERKAAALPWGATD